MRNVRTYSKTFTKEEMQRVVIILLFHSCWFQVDPLPEDKYEVQVKPEQFSMLANINVVGPPPLGKEEKKFYILSIESMEGEDTQVRVTKKQTELDLWQEGELFFVVEIWRGKADIVDHGYRTREEAKEAWPEAT